MKKHPRLQHLLLLMLPLVLTGCPEHVNPDPTPSKEDEKPVLTLSLFSPFTADAGGNWSGEVPFEGLSGEISVHSSADWSSSSSAAWCTVTPTGGSAKDKSMNLRIAANDSGQQRSAELVVRSGSLSVTVSVRQKGPVPFSLSPGEVEIDAGGGQFEVKVTCQTGYKLSSTPDWVKDITGTTPKNQVHQFSVLANPDYEPRSGVVVFCDDLGTCLPVSVRQKAREGAPAQVDWTRDFYHRSLYLDFTGTWCGFCPRMARGLTLFKKAYPDKLVDIEIHDQNSTLYFNGCPPLQNLWNIHSFPTGILDARTLIQNQGTPESNVETLRKAFLVSEAGIKPVSAFGWSSFLSGRELSVFVDLFLKKAGDYKVTVVVLEKGVVTSQSDYDDPSQHLSSYLHNDVARIALTDMTGDPFSVSADRSVKSLSYSVSIPISCKTENLKIAVYVQRAYSADFPKLNESDFDGWFVDNCAVAPVGATVVPALVTGAGGNGNEDFTDGKPIDW